MSKMFARRLEIVQPAGPETVVEEDDIQMNLSIRRPLMILMWTSLGIGIVAGALYLGNELRKKRLANRTPYDSYSHAGEDQSFNGTEYGVGI
jgi:hypothetical protein